MSFEGVLGLRRSVETEVDRPVSSTAALLKQTVEQTLEENPTAAITRENQLLVAGEYGQPISAEAARSRLRDEGLEGHLTVPGQGTTTEALDILVERKRTELKRAELEANSRGGAALMIGRLGAAFAASLVDPLNIAAGYLPIVPPSRYRAMLDAVTYGGRAASLARRTGVRALVGAGEGTAGSTLIEPLIVSSKEAEQADYGAVDSLFNIAFGGVFGGGLHVVGGGGVDLYRMARGQPLVTPDGGVAPPPQAPAPDVPRGTLLGGETSVRVGDAYVPARWALVEADEVAATMSKAENQARDRGRAASEAQVRDIAANLDFNLLADNGPLMDVGAPTLARDGRIIGGNGRMAAIRAAYEAGTGYRYQEPLQAALARFGIDVEELAKFKRPVLVRVLGEDVDIRRAAVASNEGGALRMSALEQAAVDAERLGTLEGLDVGDAGELNRPGNIQLIRRWVGEQPINQRAALQDADGYLSVEGLTRLRNAILHRAFGDSPTLARLIEAVDPGLRNVAAALTRAAGRVAEVREGIKTGDLYDLDISPDVQAAVERLVRLRDEGLSVQDYLAQGQMFGAELSPEAVSILSFLDANVRSPAGMADFLSRYYEGVSAAGSPKQADIFGGGPPSRATLLERAGARVPSAAEVVAGLRPETREAALRTAVAQAVTGREIDVEAVVDLDPSRQTSADPVAAARSAAEANASPQQAVLADFEAAAAVPEPAPLAPVLDEAQAALDEARTVAVDIGKAGAESYKFSRANAAPIFYSQALTVAEALPAGKAGADQWLATLRNKGVKQEELDWIGLGDWLRSLGRSATRDEVVDFIRANQITVTETVLGGVDLPSLADADIAQHVQTLRDAGFEVTQNPEDPTMVAFADPQDSGVVSADEIAGWADDPDAPVAREVIEAARAIERHFTSVPDWDEVPGGLTRPTKFGQYVLPGGGQGYRELLLTLARPRVLVTPTDTTGWTFVPRGDNAGLVKDASGATMAIFTDTNALSADALIERARINHDERRQRDADQLPTSQTFSEPHFHEDDVLAHVRFNERTDRSGQRVLFVEEVQSQWHQLGRKFGYRDPGRLAEIRRRMDELRAIDPSRWTPELEAEETRLIAERDSLTGISRVPDAPFKTTWPELAMKRVIRWAAENGYDRIAWTTGRQQADRYDLSTHVDAISVKRWSDGTYGFLAIKDRATVSSQQGLSADDLDRYIGNDLAEQFLESGEHKAAASGGSEYVHTFSGLDLKIGGEGMIGFYDKMLPAVAARLGKKHGAKVSTTTLGTFDVKRLEQVAQDEHGMAFDDLDPARRRAIVRRLGGDYESDTLEYVVAFATPDRDGELFTNSDTGAVMRWYSRRAAERFIRQLGIPPEDVRVDVAPQREPTKQWAMDITPSLKDAALRGQPLFARGAGQPAKATDIDAVVRQSFGEATEALVAAGRLRIVDDVEQVPGGPFPPDTRGVYSPDGTTYIVAANTPPDLVRGIVLHEVGVHAGMEEMLGPELWGYVRGDLGKLLEAGNEAVLRARSMVPPETRAAHVNEETLAYLVQNSPTLPLVRRVIAAIRAWWFRLTGGRVKLTADDMVSLAQSALRRQARQGVEAEPALAGARLSAQPGAVTSSKRTINLPPISRDVAVAGGVRGSRKTDVLVNPTEAELKRFAGRDIEDFRIAVDKDGNLYAWDSGAAIHGQVTKAMGIDMAPLGEASDVVLAPKEVYPYLRGLLEGWAPGDTMLPGGVRVLFAASGEAKLSRGAALVTDANAELAPFDDAIKRSELYGKAVRAAAASIGNDEAARMAMRASTADKLATEEIDALLDQLKVEHRKTRAGLRKAREQFTAEDDIDAMQDAATVAAETVANNIALDATIAARDAALALSARTKGAGMILNEFAANPREGLMALLGGSSFARRGAKESVFHWQRQYFTQWSKGVIADLEQAGLADAFVRDAYDRDVARALWQMGQKQPRLDGIAPEAVRIAEVVRKYQEDARSQRNRFGAWIGKLSDYIGSQRHDFIKIRQAGREAWTAFVRERLDVDRTMGEAGADDLQAMLDGLYNDFAAGRHMGEPSEQVKTVSTPGSLARRVSQSRVLHFQDADAQFEYLQRFGAGTLHEAVLMDLAAAARHTGLLRVLGPNPQDTLGRIMDAVEGSLAGDPLRRRDFYEGRGQAEALLAMLDGRAGVPGSHMAARVAAGVRAWQSMSKLGGAVISAVTDLPVYASQVRYQGRGGLLSGVGEGIGRLLQGRPKGQQRDVLRMIGSVADGMIGGIAARFDADDIMSGNTAELMRIFFRLNGLQWWTDTLREGMELGTSSWLANLRGRSWERLGADAQRLLGQYGIDGPRWDVVRLAATHAADGRQYLTPEGMRDVPESVLAGYLERVGRTVSDAGVANLRRDLADTVRSLIIDQAMMAVIEPDVRSRYFLTRGTRPGTVPGEALRFIAQFKGFPTALTRQVMGREIYGRGYDSLGEYLRRGKGDMLGLAQIILAMTVFGYAAMSAKDLLKGKTPRDPQSPQTWLAAMLQGGALGIYGDFLLGQSNRFGRNLVDTLAGPTLGVVGDIDDLRQRAMRGDDVASSAFRMLVNNTPFLNMFYSRTALDYLILYRVQEALNPGALRRMERRVQQEQGQTFLVPPSRAVN